MPSAKYASSPKQKMYFFDDVSPERKTIDVIVRDDAPQDTGLVDADGNRIFRVQDQRPIGFTTRWNEER